MRHNPKVTAQVRFASLFIPGVLVVVSMGCSSDSRPEQDSKREQSSARLSDQGTTPDEAAERRQQARQALSDGDDHKPRASPGGEGVDPKRRRHAGRVKDEASAPTDQQLSGKTATGVPVGTPTSPTRPAAPQSDQSSGRSSSGGPITSTPTESKSPPTVGSSTGK